MTIAHAIAGIDVAKDTVDVGILMPDGKYVAFACGTDRASLKKLAAKLVKRGVERVVLEATGGLELRVMAALDAAGLVFSRVNPRAVRDFAKAMGILAKTDRIDTRVLALFGERIRPLPTPMPSQTELDLAGLALRRRQLVEDRQREKNRLSRVREPVAQASIGRMIDCLNDEIAVVEAELQALVEANEDLANRRDLADSVPGIATTIATTLVINLPELGRLSTKALKKLVGVAPLNDDSATRHGARHIQGGRAVVRQALYMAAQTGYRHNPALKSLYERLRAKGLCHKAAIIACVGKLISILNAILKTGKPYDAKFATT